MRLVFDAAPGPGRRRRPRRPRRPVPARRQRGRRRRARRAAAASCRSPAPSGSRGPTSRRRPRPGSTAGGPHHTVLSTARRRSRTLDDFAEMAGTELVVIDADTTTRVSSPTSCAGTRPTTGWPRACDAGSERPLARDRPGQPQKEWSRREANKILANSPPAASALASAACGGTTTAPGVDRRPLRRHWSASPCRPSRRSAGSTTATTSRSSWREPATRSTCSTPRTTSRPRSHQIENMVTKGVKRPDHRRDRRHRAHTQLLEAARRRTSRSSPTTG